MWKYRKMRFNKSRCIQILLYRKRGPCKSDVDWALLIENYARFEVWGKLIEPIEAYWTYSGLLDLEQIIELLWSLLGEVKV